MQLVPTARQEFTEAAGGPAAVDLGEHVDEVVAHGDVGGDAGLDQAVGRGEATAALVGPPKEPIFATDGGPADLTFGLAVVELEALSLSKTLSEALRGHFLLS